MRWKKRESEIKRLRKKHGRKVKVNSLPDLSVKRTHRSQSDGFAKIVDKKPAERPNPPGTIVDTLHKQGMMVLSKKELPWAGGKKS